MIMIRRNLFYDGLFSGGFVSPVVPVANLPEAPVKQEDLEMAAFYTLTPNSKTGERDWAWHIFEVLSWNATHVLLRCLNPMGRLPAAPILVLRNEFTFSRADDIARASSEHGNPVYLKQEERDEGPRYFSFGRGR